MDKKKLKTVAWYTLDRAPSTAKTYDQRTAWMALTVVLLMLKVRVAVS